MEAGDVRAVMGALLLPPAGPLLLALLGLVLVRAGRRGGFAIGLFALVLLWLLSTHVVSLGLARQLLPPVEPVGLAQLRQARVQAVVVLGGGVVPEAPEYGVPQPSSYSLERLRYGVRLARLSGLPLGFSGGVGWAGRSTANEAEAARLSARQDFGTDLRWAESASRDTRDSAERMAALLKRDGIQRIALVTDSWHLPRAALEFRRHGLVVLPAPMGFLRPRDRPLLEWLPSAHALLASRQLLREWAAWQWARFRPVD
ncbi:YdcF family protein [Ramlibacter sp. AW1]|uniref:YdcF family protein n=1 Tax=Ramlibacter aurantiacus TaxID=2801330 RepID=A0A937D566_9BURK|nr:YdcF family protein [Ramlibacter aurantiacus]MBL0421027.1 YdcF family protein [Ramlibacter aurantiacus]